MEHRLFRGRTSFFSRRTCLKGGVREPPYIHGRKSFTAEDKNTELVLAGSR